jgi:hypothetical protein
MKIVVRGLVALALSIIGNSAHGLTFTATGPGDDTNKILSALATFVVSDLKLVITLSNTASNDPDKSAEILTGVFFTLAGDPPLARTSAVLGSDTAIKNRPGISGPGMNVGSEWVYGNGLTGLPDGANEGLTIASLNKIHKRNHFSGPNLGPSGGVQFGVTTAFDDLGNDKGDLKHKQLIENTVVFTLSQLPTDFTLADISNVSFQYGTSLKDPGPNLAGTIRGEGNNPVIPEPGTTTLIATGLLWSFALVGRPRRTSTSVAPSMGRAKSAPLSGGNRTQMVRRESG